MYIGSSSQERGVVCGCVVSERVLACVPPTSKVVIINIHLYPMMTFVWK
jgi:hypothetical protein